MIKQLMAVALAAQIVLGIGPAKVQAEDIVATNALTTDSASSITEMVADGQAQNRVNTGPHVFAGVTASGTWGTCSWRLSSDGVLTIGAGTGESTCWGTYAPWYGQRANIKSVKLNGEVKLPQSAEGLFADCSNLATLDVSSWDTSAVTDMNRMFYRCSSLTTLDVSKWDTSAVTDMSSMFYNCSSLTTLDTSNWDTSKVTGMGSMFHNCGKLTTLDVSKWNTSAVKDMQWMFNGCRSLTTLDVSNWDTSAVTDMNRMFKNCSNLTTLDVSNWNAGAVTDMRYMFSDCRSLTTLDVSNWKISAVTNMYCMFGNCSKLTTLDVSRWSTSAVKNMGGMFAGCSSLTTLDVSKWDTSAVTNMNNMFYSCDNITALDVSNWDTSKVTNMNRLFYESGLRKIKIGSGFVNSAKSNEVFPTPKITISGRTSTKTWGLGSEAADKQYKADELATLGQTAGALTGTWYAQGKQELSFISWNTKPDGSGTTYMPGDPLPDMNMDLYAQWGIAYKIAYDLDGGENNSANPSTYAPGQRTITLAAPTKRGYKFTGWTGSNGNTAQQNVSITGSDTGDKTYKANWEPITYTVRFNTALMPLKPIPDMICTYDVHYTPPMIEETDPNHSMAGYFIDFTGYSVDPLLPDAMEPSYRNGGWSPDIYNLSDVDGDVVTLTPTAKVYKVDDQGNFIPIN